jgi:hypothetical protein
VAVFFEVDQRDCNHPIELMLSLLTEDGQPVQVPGPTGLQDLLIVQQIIVPSPAGAPIAAPGVGNSLIEIFPGLALAPGGYEWRVRLAGQENADWNARFRVMHPPQAPTISFGTTTAPPETPGE